MKIKIEAVSENIFQEIYKFEIKNKEFFESTLPPRPTGYQQYDTFTEIINELMKEQCDGEYYMYIIRDNNNDFVGRINLNIDHKSNEKVADLGYRIDYDKQGLGYTSQAIELVLNEAFYNLGINEVTAGTSTENYASQRVLEKNGFKKVGEEKKVMKINDKWVDGVLYSIKKNCSIT